ncbi:response regulator transcription factor [Eisenbergiella sp.]
MWRIMVIDDEARQCRGLKNILLKEFQGEVEVWAFTTAAEALDFFREKGADIIITDICMPEMDGLQLLEAVEKEGSGVKVILLTGYAEFEYARKALTLGAMDYLLKPLNPDRMHAVLEKAFQEISEERVLAGQKESMQRQLDIALPVYMEQQLNQWVYGRLSAADRHEIEEIIACGLPGCVIVTRLRGFQDWSRKAEKELLEDTKYRIKWWMKELLQREYHSISFFSYVLPETFVTVITEKRAGANAVKLLERSVPAESFPVFSGGGYKPEKLFICLGQRSENLFLNIEECYRSAVTVMDYRFYFPEAQLLSAGFILANRISEFAIGLAEEEALKDVVKNMDRGEAFRLLEGIASRCLDHGYPEPDKFRSVFQSLLRHVSLFFHMEENLDELWKHEKEEESIESFMQGLYAALELLVKKAEERGRDKNAAFAERFSRYIEQHYSEDIPLEEIAAVFQLTPTYFSNLVKEATGSSFSRNLTDVRMKRAKAMLQETDCRIYEIARSTGYEDVKYFNRVFKKEIGITPMQFREQLLKVRREADE